jgi:hypothetical protein
LFDIYFCSIIFTYEKEERWRVGGEGIGEENGGERGEYKREEKEEEHKARQKQKLN